MFKIMQSSRYLLESLLIVGYVFVCISSQLSSNSQVQAFPTSVDFFSQQSSANKLADTKLAEESFHQLINSKPDDSIIIGELKPNASALDLMLLRNKIASTILKMQELDKQKTTPSPPPQTQDSASADCFIEVTRVEKVPGKCHRASNGVPICQSDNYMAITNECN